MRVTKPLDLDKLTTELRTASVYFRVLALVSRGNPDDPHDADLWDTGDRGWIDLPPEAEPVVEAHDATPFHKLAETAEDTERLALVNDRAAEDPAFAALADLALGKDR